MKASKHFALVQMACMKGDIQKNLNRHCQIISQLSQDSIQVAIFPELSLTGYEPSLARSLALTEPLHELQKLHQHCIENGVSAVVGAPIRYDDHIYIAAVHLLTNGDYCIYLKMHLHSGEDRVFSAGDRFYMSQHDHTRVAHAVCADTLHSEHAKQGAHLYAAGVLITPGGYDNDAEVLAKHARDYDIAVGIANHCGPSGGYDVAGKTAVWWSDQCLAMASDNLPEAVIARHSVDGWQAKVKSLNLD